MERGKLHPRKLSKFVLMLITVTVSDSGSHLLVACSDKEKAVLAEAVGTDSMAGE